MVDDAAGLYGAGALPGHLDDLSPKWLTERLQNRYPGVVVKDWDIVEVRNGHTTKMRVALDLNDAGVAAGIPRQVCLKANWAVDFLFHTNIHELEARFYHYIRQDVGSSAPQSYYEDWDGTGQGLVVMDDLGAAGGEFGQSTQHIGVDGVARGLESLAVLHGGWWNSPKLDQHPWLEASMVARNDTGQLRDLWPYIEMNLPKPEYRAILPDWLYSDPDRLSRAFDAQAAHERAMTGPRCVVHGDAHLGNSYLRPDGRRIWIDWQLIRKGRPWRDITYFMLGSLTIEERRNSERDLLAHYRESLSATGAEDVLGLEEIWAEYRRWPIYGMQSWLSNQDSWGQKGLPMVERFYTAAADLDTIRLLEAG